MSMPALSWMSIVVGDPLYRPYATWLQIDEKSEGEKNSSDWEAYHEFAVQNGSRPTAEFRTPARQFASCTHNGAMMEDLGLMEARGGNFSVATNYFQQAKIIYAKREDILRVALEEADALIKQNKSKRALELIRSVLGIASDAPAAVLLKKLEAELRAAVSANPRRP